MPKSILAAIDLAASSDQIIAAAQEYAEAFSAKVYLVHVAEVGPTPGDAAIDLSLLSDPISGPDLPINVDRDDEAVRLRAEHRALQGLKTKLSDAGIGATALFIEGATVEKLLLEIDRLDIDLVIIGSHSPSFLRDFFSGSTMKEVVREARCPVLVLPPPSD
jgi:nucleotide-binding universal stress UspA family protein